jgi:hypothetical protein
MTEWRIPAAERTAGSGAALGRLIPHDRGLGGRAAWLVPRQRDHPSLDGNGLARSTAAAPRVPREYRHPATPRAYRLRSRAMPLGQGAGAMGSARRRALAFLRASAIAGAAVSAERTPILTSRSSSRSSRSGGQASGPWCAPRASCGCLRQPQPARADH